MPPRSRTSIVEVAKHADVAISSVSRVLSGHPDVSDAMRKRVMSAVDDLGYRTDLLAQGLRRRETLTVGFVVGDISNPLLAAITMGAETRLRDAGYSMLLTNSENDPQIDAAQIGLLQQRRVDGLLLSLASEDNPAMLAALDGLDIPYVLIDREVDGSVKRRPSAVLSDHASGMQEAVGHLLDLGHRRIALVLGRPLRYSRQRRRGLEQAYAERDISEGFEILEGSSSAEHAARATERLLGRREAPPTAIVAGSNQLLVGILATLHRRRLKPGTDISLVSCDTVALTELLDPPIAVVRRDNRELGRTGAELLLRRLQDDTIEPETVLLPTEFVRQPSCVAAPSEPQRLPQPTPRKSRGLERGSIG
jgi:LacI family transcriptional regulator